MVHRTVRWCTGLSGEPTVGRANGRPRNPRVTRGRANGLMGAPDCPVCTGLSGVHRTVSGAPTAPNLQRSAVPILESNLHQTLNSACPVAHQTVRCTNGHPLFMSGARSPSYSGADDRCRVVAVGAPDTVWCPCRPLARATRRPRIARSTVALATVGSPDSPVHHWTVRCTTGQSGDL